MSSHECSVIKIEEILPHPNADRLDITQAFGWTCIVAKGQFKVGDLAGFVIPDSIVQTERPEFAFLMPKAKTDGTYRIRGQKLRGINSAGLLVPAKKHWKLGDDVADELGIVHWEPDLYEVGKGPNAPKNGATMAAKKPVINGMPVPEYTDIENFKRYHMAFDELQDNVVFTEKIHGGNWRAVYSKGELHVGSHHQWKLGDKRKSKIVSWLLSLSEKRRWHSIVARLVGTRRMAYAKAPADIYWTTAKKYNLEEKLKLLPNITLYGEVYGSVQKGFPYDATPEEPLKLVIFDAMKDGRYMDWDGVCALCDLLDLPTVPELYRGPWDKEKALTMAEGMTMLGGKHIREGIVVKGVKEMVQYKLGRTILKVVSDSYLQSKVQD